MQRERGNGLNNMKHCTLKYLASHLQRWRRITEQYVPFYSVQSSSIFHGLENLHNL